MIDQKLMKHKVKIMRVVGDEDIEITLSFTCSLDQLEQKVTRWIHYINNTNGLTGDDVYSIETREIFK
jgi:hypothetical protein